MATQLGWMYGSKVVGLHVVVDGGGGLGWEPEGYGVAEVVGALGVVLGGVPRA
jgi:hypothetical protein